jgi:hypothetical protein
MWSSKMKIGKLKELKAWRDERFAEPKPPMRTVQRWAMRGDIPAVKRGKTWFVDLYKEALQSGNPLIDQFLI